MSKNNVRLMAHLVAGFPDKNGFLQALQALKDGGADTLELQIPFSDPTADGPAITYANEEAIRNGFHVAQIFDYIKHAKNIGFERIVVMTYANIPFVYGIKKYVQDMKNAGVSAILAPDLPIEDEENFYQSAFDTGIDPMPVAVINMSEERIKLLKQKPFKKIYIAIRAGITGKQTALDPNLKLFFEKFTGYELYAGFGIKTPEQIKELSTYADVLVVGSYFTETIINAVKQKTDIYAEVKAAISYLLKN
ncbi:MAG: tryptophan synthase subunit alpha [Candidatus Omnitrophica bacterium]|nr:tryptophan synthase subunit alpha [Candidatus Omnitrophota bacterium]